MLALDECRLDGSRRAIDVHLSHSFASTYEAVSVALGDLEEPEYLNRWYEFDTPYHDPAIYLQRRKFPT